jgi:hypothetical protein
MAESATKIAPARPATGGKTLPALLVRYYKRMRAGRVYPVHVCWKKAERGVAGKAITLKLTIPGAHVVPTERTLKPTDPEDKAVFFATPLASGKLHGSSLESWYQETKVQDMPLPCKVTSQFWTWFFLVMTLLAPAFLLHYCKYHPYQRDALSPKASLQKTLGENLPDKTLLKDLFSGFDDFFDSVDGGLQNGITEIGETYAALIDACNAYPIPLAVGLVFLVLTLLSAWWHGAKRKKRLGDPISIPATAL